MNFLPYENFELHTNLSTDEVFYKLRANVDTRRKWLIFTNKPFWGNVEREYFKIWRDTLRNQNFTPVVFGIIKVNDRSTIINIKMRMKFLSFLFWILWLGTAWFILFSAFSNLIIESIKSGIWQFEQYSSLLVVLGMFVFGYLFVIVIFKLEVDRIKEFLAKLTEVDVINIKDVSSAILESRIIKLLFLITFAISFSWVVLHL